MTMTNAIDPLEWVPASGHQLRLAGVHFDAVRIEGLRGELAAAQLIEAADGDAGPVVCEVTGFRWMYFLLAPGEVRRHRWPLGVQRFGERGSRTATYIGVPALDGNTWPLRWYSEPSERTPYVDAERLLKVFESTVM
ncbi:hypothetical protein OG864_24935 [Streptomyces sp. NBC_00124]|uniref:hypothetical protein n=1 Tax=Streptomyces sp. NBC_00124 TaxID=2975662 RepID=UPI00225802A2|nr:hypothetical protein [Streptomyces sp. NBC_00124]MCX5361958.1 hypothetical protein [Streptomyces sp. NBC_00124]